MAVCFTQTKYVHDLVNRETMPNANCVTALMPSTSKLSKHDSTSLLNPHHYWYLVGVLQYVTLARPTIAFSVNKTF